MCKMAAATCTCSVVSHPDRLTLTLKWLGGLGPPPPRHFARLLCNTQSSRRDTLWLFFFQVSRTFWHQICDARGYGSKLRNFLYMHVGPKMAPKCDFVYKINANWVFSHSSYKYCKSGNIRGTLIFAYFAQIQQARIQKPAKIFAVPKCHKWASAQREFNNPRICFLCCQTRKFSHAKITAFTVCLFFLSMAEMNLF